MSKTRYFTVKKKKMGVNVQTIEMPKSGQKAD